MAVTRDDVQDPTGQRTNVPGRGFLRGIGIGAQYAVTANTVNGIAGNPINGEIGYAPGATFQNPLTAIVGNMLWVNIGTVLSATWLNIDGIIQGLGINNIVTISAATYTVTPTVNSGKTMLLARAGGITVTLPNATGTGNAYNFFVSVTDTTPSYIIKRGTAADVMSGTAVQAGSAGATTMWATAANSNTITLNGTTTGGILGDIVRLRDVAANQWQVEVVTSITGTAATPFSNS